jgi:glycosyltransferase involved in cell wall biosynthesis
MGGVFAIFVRSLSGGGAERAMLNLARGIADRGHRVDLLLARADGPYLGDVPASVRLIDLEASRTLLSLGPLMRYLKQECPRALLSSMNYANIVALWAHEQNTPSVSTRNSIRWRQRMMPSLMRRFYPWADGITAVSEGVGSDLARIVRLSEDRIQVIHNPVARPEIRDLMLEGVEHPWFQPGGPPVLLAVGSLTAQKDFPTLIEAFGEVRKARPGRLVILGEGRDRRLLETLISKLGLEKDVDLPGFTNNPYAYMRRASAFVLSSKWEGLPTVLIEALYCGTPVIATDCPSGPREILAGGEHGRLLPVGDFSSLVRSLDAALAGELRPAPPECCRRYEWDSVVDQYIELLAF